VARGPPETDQNEKLFLQLKFDKIHFPAFRINVKFANRFLRHQNSCSFVIWVSIMTEFGDGSARGSKGPKRRKRRNPTTAIDPIVEEEGWILLIAFVGRLFWRQMEQWITMMLGFPLMMTDPYDKMKPRGFPLEDIDMKRDI
jgi:hypothetical protein